MDRIYSESNDENDHTERIRRQRLSSILKAPRSPLKDLGSGNEFTQDYDTGKRRKNSRRVSFADTIKQIFKLMRSQKIQREQQMKGIQSYLTSKYDLLTSSVTCCSVPELCSMPNAHFLKKYRNEDAEAVHCEITGMDTLLHAPIQTLVQQTEVSLIWNVNNQTNRNDRTLIFLDENEMDMTASHTAVITRNLKSNEEIDKPRKIDIKSFLAELTSKNEGSEMKTEFRFFCDPTEKPDRDPVKKIDFNEFLTSLKSSETFVSPTVEGPDKENLFFVPIQVSESSGFSPTEYVYSHTQENTDNVTRIFRGEDGGMDITKCHVSNINTMFPNTCEASSKQLEYGDVTVAYGDMDMTTCQTVKMSPSKNNAVTIENQSQNTRMDLSSSFAADNSRLKRTSNDQLIVPQASERCVENKTVSVEEEEDITRSHTILTDNHKASETSNQGCRSRTVVPGCVSPESVFHNDKTIVFSSCNDMEMTGNCTMVNYNETSKATGRFFFDAFKKAGNASSLLMEKTVSGDENMDITKCQITSDNHVLRQCKNKPQTIFSVPNNASEKGIRSHGAASETPGLHLCANPGAWTSKDTFQLRAVKGTEKSLLGDKTIVFSGEDMNITRSYIAKNVEEDIASQLPPVSAAMSNGMKFKPQIFGNKSSSSRLNDQEEMEITKCHAVVIDNQNTGITTSLQQIQPKAIPGEKWDKQVNEAVNPLNLDKEISCSEIGDHMDIKRSHPNAKTIIFSSQEQEMDISKSHIFVSHNCEISQQLRKSLVNPSLAYTNDKTVFPDDQSMDITRNHIDALEFAPMNLRGAEQLSLARTSMLDTENSQMASLLEKSEREENTLFPPKKDLTSSCIMIAEDSLQKQRCDQCRWTYAKKTLSRNDLLLSLPNKKTVIFSADDDMEMTKTHALATDNKIYLQGKISSKAVPLVPADKTVVFTSNDDMDITRPNTVVIDKSLAAPQIVSELPADKTVVFTCSDDMDITRPNTVVIDKSLAAPQIVSELDKGTGTRRLIGSSSEKTVVFSIGDENDMEMTKTHALATDNKIYLQGKISSNDDMDITRPNTVVIDKSLAAPQIVSELDKGTGTRRLIGSSSEKTVVFSIGDENDMEMTKTHALATDNKIYLQGKISSKAVPLVPADKTVVFTCNDDMDITRPNTVVIDKSLAAPQIVSELDKTVVFPLGGENDMLVTKSHTAAINHEIVPQGKRPPPAQSAFQGGEMVFAFNQADMEIIESHTVDKTVEKIMHVDSKTVLFVMGDDMETTKIHTVSLDDEIALQGAQTTHVVPVLPANETIMFTCNQDKMDITASHTVAINSNNLQGSENQEVSSESHQQQNLWRISAPTYGERMHFKKEETDTFKIHNVATEKSIGPLSLPLPEVILDIVQEPQNVVNLPTGSSSSVYCQDLRKQVKLKSKRVSFKLPENQTESLTYKTESMSQVQIPVQQSHLSKESIDSLIRDAVNVLETGSIDLKDNSEKLASTRHEHKPSEVDTDGADMVISYKESKECKRVTAEWEKLTKDFQEDSEQTKQFSQVSDICAEQVDPKLVPELSGIVNICIRLKNCRRKSEVFPVSQTAAGSNLAENFPKLATHSEDLLSLGKDVEKESNNAFDIKEEENVYFETGDAPAGTPLDTTHRDKCQVRKLPLGIFPPKLPNKRDSVAPSVCLNVKATSRVEAQASEINSVTGKTSDIICPIERQNLSPSQYIDEELLPTCPEEMDSAEFVSYEPHDGTCNEMNKKERFCNKSNPLEEQETCNNQKRAWEQEEEELQKGKKIKRTESWDRDTTKEQQIIGIQAETHEGENPSSPSSKSLERTNSSNSSCLDSLKADTDFSIQRSSQRESQLLMDSICEENVFEKFQDGVITVGEFFTLLQVHILIQKPRQSHLPANYVVDTAPTPEDLIFSQYIYQPKLQIYEEDCQVLSQMRENLKLCAGVQDKLLVDVNKNLWEVMRTCSDKELKNFGTELNKMKSCFTKKSKVLAHKGKVKLYDSLVQNTQIQWEKLQSRIAKVDEFLREMDSCLCALETVAELEECDADISDPVTDWESKVRHLEKVLELENLKAQEEALQRNLTNLEARKQQGFSEINCLQTKASNCEELLDRYNFTEWEMSEWSDQQAVFTFLYDSIELTIIFGPPVDGAVFNDNPCRKIINMSFESLLDEKKAPLSSCLVQRLIFQFIESQGFWQTKCTTMQHLPQMLHEISLVVNRCRLLGEEIEFLNRWGGKCNLLKTEVDNTKVKLLFSSCTAFAKFEVIFSLSANYPSTPLQFTVQKQIGSLGHDEISAVLSSVPLGTNYLKRMVKMIHHNLLQGSLTVH
uniref:Kinetochore scaffold 1 n=1 Tax=Pelodiscus sinensis TaxID=13735 RepID=K7G1Q5_PELSI